MPYSQFTLVQLRAFFYQQVNGNTAFFRTDEVDGILQEAFRVFNVLTGFWRDRVVMAATVAGQHFYTVPATLSYILRVEVNQRPLGSSSLWDLDYGQPQWEGESAASGEFPKVFAPAGTNQFALWPASFAGGESLVVEGVIPAPTLSTVGFVNLGKDELETILDYAEHIAQFKEGGQEFDASQELLKSFLQECGERNGMLMQSSKFRGYMGLTDRKKRPMRLPDARVGAR